MAIFVRLALQTSIDLLQGLQFVELQPWKNAINKLVTFGRATASMMLQ
jgi:hypothetical protein